MWTFRNRCYLWLWWGCFDRRNELARRIGYPSAGRAGSGLGAQSAGDCLQLHDTHAVNPTPPPPPLLLAVVRPAGPHHDGRHDPGPGRAAAPNLRRRPYAATSWPPCGRARFHTAGPHHCPGPGQAPHLRHRSWAPTVSRGRAAGAVPHEPGPGGPGTGRAKCVLAIPSRVGGPAPLDTDSGRPLAGALDRRSASLRSIRRQSSRVALLGVLPRKAVCGSPLQSGGAASRRAPHPSARARCEYGPFKLGWLQGRPGHAAGCRSRLGCLLPAGPGQGQDSLPSLQMGSMTGNGPAPAAEHGCADRAESGAAATERVRALLAACLANTPAPQSGLIPAGAGLRDQLPQLGLLGPARRAGPFPLGRDTCSVMTPACDPRLFASRSGSHRPELGSPKRCPGLRMLRPRTRSSRRRSGPVDHRSSQHVTSATCGARTGPAGPVAPPAEAGSRDLKCGDGTGIASGSSCPPTKCQSLCRGERTRRGTCSLASPSPQCHSWCNTNNHPVEIPGERSKCRRSNLLNELIVPRACDRINRFESQCWCRCRVLVVVCLV